MKHIYTLVALCAVISSVSVPARAQGKLDLESRILIASQQSEQAEETQEPAATIGERRLKPFSMSPVSKIGKVPVLVRMKEGVDPSMLEDAGFEVSSRLRTIAVVNAPMTRIGELAAVKGVDLVSLGKQQRLYMDNARKQTGVDRAHSGIDYQDKKYTFTGKGVVTGIYDVGVAPNHINFKKSDGTSRVKGLYSYYKKDGDEDNIYIRYYNAATVGEFKTDTVDETHGTHTLGIMAGGYRDTVYTPVVEPYDDNGTEKFRGGFETIDNPFYGCAPESDIYVGCGQLWSAATVDAMTRMAEYAKEQGQPIVINYSAGSLTGPHDGTDAFSAALGEIADEYGAVICVAAGNDGGGKVSFSKTFSSTTDAYKTCITPLEAASPVQALALIDIWGSDDTPFTVQFNSYKPKSGSTAAADKTLFTLTKADQGVNIANTANAANGVTKNTDLANAFKSAQIIAFSEVDSTNMRYHVMALVNYVQNYRALGSYILSQTKSFIHINIKGQGGKSVTGTLGQYGEFTAQSTVSGTVDGNDQNTINDSATHPSVVSVGAEMSRRYACNLAGSVSYLAQDKYTDGAMAYFSSYGPTPDGRQLPEIVAPGWDVVSSYSPYYVAKGNEGETADDMVARMTDNGSRAGSRAYYWGTMSGTSMATPFVAGSIALWLEADPTLTPAQVKEILAKTAVKDDALAGADDRCGSGRIDVAAGIKEILSRNVTSVGGIDEDERNLVVEQDGGALSVFVGGEKEVTLRIYSTQGALVGTTHSQGDTARFDTDRLAKGVYIVEILPAGGGRSVRKISVR